MELGFKGKTAVITGGATGIGAASALLFAKEGCNIAVCGRTQSKLDAFLKRAEAEGINSSKVFAHSCDVADDGALENFGKIVYEKFGSIDAWVNNAGTSLRKHCLDYTKDDWQRVLDVNLVAVWEGTRVAANYMKGKGGAIVNLSSFNALIPNAGNLLYGVTKTGVVALTKIMAAELAKDNVRVNGIIPGYIETDMTGSSLESLGAKYFTDPVAMNRLGKPDDLAGGLVFLCSDYAQFITGEMLVISGGKYLVQNQAIINEN